MLALATLAIAILTVLNGGARDRLARAYARQFRVAQEESCPAVIGKAFWFACAGEVRRLHPSAALTVPEHDGVAAAAAKPGGRTSP